MDLRTEIEMVVCRGRDRGIRIDPVELAPDIETGRYSGRLWHLALALHTMHREISDLYSMALEQERRG